MTTTASERDLPVARHIGELVHALIWSQRRKQGSVAAAVGVSGSTFSKKLRGEVPITVDELMRIAGVLGVDPGELLPRLDSNQQPSGYASLQVENVYPLVPRHLSGGKAPPHRFMVETCPRTGPRMIHDGAGQYAGDGGGPWGLVRVE